MRPFAPNPAFMGIAAFATTALLLYVDAAARLV